MEHRLLYPTNVAIANGITIGIHRVILGTSISCFKENINGMSHENLQ